MIRLKALQGKGVSIQNRKSKIENWYKPSFRDFSLDAANFSP
jgi:hypothetical protein